MRAALKIAYDGRAFHGFARQPDVRTVEGEVLFSLEKAGIIAGAEASRFRGASRTDAGVSALGNVVAFDTAAKEEMIVGAFNDAARDVWAWALAALPPDGDPRRARERWYRYHLAGSHDVGLLRETGRAFVGTHDFAAFASPDERRTTRRVDAVAVEPVDDGVLVDVRAPSFLRGMVRRIVAALLAVERGDASVDGLRGALEEGRGPDLGTVPPEPLTLMDVDLDVPFRVAVDGACRERVRARHEREAVANRFWREAWERLAASEAGR